MPSSVSTSPPASWRAAATMLCLFAAFFAAFLMAVFFAVTFLAAAFFAG